ncbi:helix-turn-helix transcriptional regulator [Clostridium sp. Marseille-P299]|uniref:helix-turn-helix transcriptional regulator n=1 Tax=Clostridium sp. Marseille-P299 TaxID=1805477 RepID=UPI00083616CE|nr:AraC family transcriptional regulator [Clostridium sp. Marseille-P299]
MSEQFFNHLEIYSLLYSGNTKEAIKVFKSKVGELKNESILLLRLYLNSLNHGIYNYILMKESISLHECCYENSQLIQQCTSRTYIDIGIQIITSFSNCTDYLIEKHKNEHIKKAIAYIHNHLSESLSLDVVCKEVCVNRCYLCDLFKQEVHMTFSDYVLKQRISLAKKLLKTSNIGINVVAFKCGFSSTSYFSTCFRKIEGISPSEYR